ncbi:hypothetical protein ASG31_05860 [Chryseobacterium sp. Leaf404]|uniref:hypothetical protein n=1 Tax=unclassified Chryseobacterium TaxID=2593645 RepID=UPI000700109A|nr:MULTISPECIES: hypothetical protein [unclassified Chryseobacterium]KQT18251.1 hypothetical protein ASG31_05860 [Chryseobacterium sp. Leaf404]
MKNLLNIGFIAILSGLVFTSCNDNEDYETIQSVEKVKIDSVAIVSDTMSVFDVQSIRTYQKFTQQCEGFYGYDYAHTADFDRTITAYKFKTNANCGSGTFKTYNQINFAPKVAGKYNFKFSTGDNTFITKTIVVQ